MRGRANAIAGVERDFSFELTEVDISTDPALHHRYGERVPVLDVDGNEALELDFDAATVRDLLGRVDA